MVQFSFPQSSVPRRPTFPFHRSGKFCETTRTGHLYPLLQDGDKGKHPAACSFRSGAILTSPPLSFRFRGIPNLLHRQTRAPRRSPSLSRPRSEGGRRREKRSHRRRRGKEVRGRCRRVLCGPSSSCCRQF
jgi:hypothetical protein